MKRLSAHPKIILSAVTVAILFYFFGNVIVDSNAFLFSSGGDGIKNYYTPAWFVKYDSGTRFTGMNYPYGEPVTYTDNQPIVSWVLKFISLYVTDISGQTVGILNLLMIFSFVPTVLFLFLIIEHFHLPKWYAMICSLLIGFMSPQLERWGGHYGLAYMYFIPMVWWVMIQFYNRKKNFIWWILNIVTITLAGFIHPYMLMILSIFVLLYSFLSYISNYSKKSFRRKEILAIVSAIIPIIIFSMYSNLTDTVTDRIETPWGFFMFYSTFESVFLPCRNPLFEPVMQLFHINYNWEGLAYVGIAGFFVLILSLVRIVRYGIKKKWHKIFSPSIPRELVIALWAAIFILLYSMCYPFRFHLEWLADKFSFIKQFRSLGRFAWVFYYVFTVYTVYYIFINFRRLRIKGKKVMSVMLVAVLLSIWMYEAVIFAKDRVNNQNNKTAAVFFSNNEYSEWLIQAGHSPNEFQAILPLPFFCVGTDKIFFDDAVSAEEAFKSSLNLGLPMVAYKSARSSVSQALKNIQLFSDSLIEKEIIKDCPNRKPFLVITTKEPLLPNEQFIVKKSEKIFENDRICMYLLPLENLKPDYKNVTAYKENLTANSDLLNDEATENHFENGDGKYAFDGKRGLYLEKGELPLFKGKLKAKRDSVKYEFSVWVKVFRESESSPGLWYKQYDNNGNLIEQRDVYSNNYYFDVFGGWIKMPYSFTLYSRNNIVEFYLKGTMIAADEMLIRPATVNVISNEKPDGSFFFNNIPVPAQ